MPQTGTADPRNVLAGVAGAGTSPFDLAFLADATGAVLPTDGTTALDTTFFSMGLVQQTGASVDTNISTQDIPAFGSFSPVRTLITSEVRTIKVAALEHNKPTAAVVARQQISAITVATGGKISTTLGPARDALYALVVDALDGAKRKRIVCPSVRLTALGTQQTAYGQAILGGDFTFTAYPDANGVSVYSYVTIPTLT